MIHSRYKTDDMTIPLIDPAPVTRHLRARAGSQLLVVAVHHIPVFEELSKKPGSIDEMRDRLKLAPRSAMVLLPALCAMGMLRLTPDGKLEITELGKFLTVAHPAHLIGYVGLDKDDPGVVKMAEWLRNDGPADSTQGLSYVKDDQASSPMDEPEAARFFTLALAGRAKYLAPVVAASLPKKNHLLDVAGGTGYYTYEWLLLNPGGRATIMDRPEVLKVTVELFEAFCREHKAAQSLKERVTFLPGDMLTDMLPHADLVLAASLHHDWPEEVCMQLTNRFAGALSSDGELWIHDAFLNDTLDGPLPVTDYSALLFLATKGRAYSRKEYRCWFEGAGLVPSPREIPTLMDYGLISAKKR